MNWQPGNNPYPQGYPNQMPEQPYSNQMPEQPYPNQMPEQPYPNPISGQPYPNQMPGQPYPNQMPGQPYLNQMPGQPYPNQMPGQPYPNQMNPYPHPVQVNGKALGSLILGLVGIIAWLIPLFGYPVCITGIALGAASKKGAPPDAKSTAGIVLSIIFLLATLVNSLLGVLYFL